MKKGTKCLAASVALSSLVGMVSLIDNSNLQNKKLKERSHSVMITADCNKKIPYDGALVPGALTVDSVAVYGPTALTPMIAKKQIPNYLPTYYLIFDHYHTLLVNFEQVATQFRELTCKQTHSPQPELKKPASTRGDQTNDLLSNSTQGSITFVIDKNQSVKENTKRLYNGYLTSKKLLSPGIQKAATTKFRITVDKSTTPESNHLVSYHQLSGSYKGLIKDFATLLSETKDKDQRRFFDNYKQLQQELQQKKTQQMVR